VIVREDRAHDPERRHWHQVRPAKLARKHPCGYLRPDSRSTRWVIRGLRDRPETAIKNDKLLVRMPATSSELGRVKNPRCA
jgi:hypothetical protein